MTATTSTALNGSDAAEFAAKHGLSVREDGWLQVPDALIDEALAAYPDTWDYLPAITGAAQQRVIYAGIGDSYTPGQNPFATEESEPVERSWAYSNAAVARAARGED